MFERYDRADLTLDQCNKSLESQEIASLRRHIEDLDRNTGGGDGYGLPPLLTVAEAAQFLRIGKSQLYERLRSDPDFKHIYVRWGRSYRILRDRLLALIEGVDDDAT